MRVIINWLERKKEIIVIVLLCTLIWIVCGVTDIWFWGQNKIPSFIDSKLCEFENHTWEAFFGELSLIFITVSVLSILSDNIKVIFWANIVDEQLIKPRFRNFYSYCIYAFSILAFTFAAALEDKLGLVWIYFSLSLVLMNSLSLIMIDVYYKDEEKKKELQKEYLHIVKKERNEVNIVQYNQVHNELYRQTLIGIRDLNYENVADNFTFYKENIRFMPHNNKAVTNILDFLSDRTMDDVFEILTNYFAIPDKEIDCYKLVDIQHDLEGSVIYDGVTSFANLICPDNMRKMFEQCSKKSMLSTYLAWLMERTLIREYNYFIVKIGSENFVTEYKFVFEKNASSIIKRGIDELKKKEDTELELGRDIWMHLTGACAYLIQVLMESVCLLQYDEYFELLSSKCEIIFPILEWSFESEDGREICSEEVIRYIKQKGISEEKTYFLKNVIFRNDDPYGVIKTINEIRIHK